MDRPHITAENAMKQAGMTASLYLSQAAAILDERFDDTGPNTTEIMTDPALAVVLAAMITTQAQDFHSTSLMTVLYEINDRLYDISVKLEALSESE